MGALKQHCTCERCGRMHWPHVPCPPTPDENHASELAKAMRPETFSEMLARHRAEIVRSRPQWYERD